MAPSYRHYVRSCLVLLVALVLACGVASAYAQAGYPRRVEPAINDFAGVLAAEDRAAIIAVREDMLRARGAELVVVTIGALADYDVPDRTIEAFATGLFNTWGIGDRARDDGVLLLVALRDRKVRIEVGRGYGSGYNAALQQLIERDIVPEFRAGNYGAGVVAGARGIQAVLASPPAATIAGLPRGRALGGLGAALTIAGTAVFFARFWYKSRPRCPQCKASMRAVPSKQAQQYLTEGQQVEVRVNSMRYEVWRCPRCQITTSQAAFRPSRMERCPSCHYHTLYSTSTREANKKLKGRTQVRTERRCHNCRFRDHRAELLPISASSGATASNVTSDYSSGSSHDYSSSSSYDNSSSSSSSFDSGGSSSGDGASGSW